VTIGLLYLACLTLGVVYALVAGGLGWLSDIGGGGDIHVDASGHFDAGHAHPISGTVVATFVTGFGAGGVIGHYLLAWTLVPGLLLATVSGLALAGAAFAVLDLIFTHTQGGSEFEMTEIAGREAEVITTIPEHGTGEVAYTVRGQRETSPARSRSGAAIARGELVVVEVVSGNTLYVRPKE